MNVLLMIRQRCDTQYSTEQSWQSSFLILHAIIAVVVC